MIYTKELGFGCTRLTHHFSEKAALRNLEVAVDHGITHFDLARAYGFGAAEGMVGKFIKGKRDRVTLATKVGIYPQNGLLGNLVIQNLARLTFNQFRKLRPSPKPPANREHTFVLSEMKRSLQVSLKELRTDYLDHLLLHEATVRQAQRPEILNWLKDLRREGTIRSFGIASYADMIREELSALPEDYEVVQTNLSFPEKQVLPTDILTLKKVFFFSPFLHLRRIRMALQSNPKMRKMVGELLEMDVERAAIALCFIQQQLEDLNSTTIFTSSSNQRIAEAIGLWRAIDREAIRAEFPSIRKELGALLQSVSS
jgi:diketogulonate reductase-like aldo/keto reductase